MAIEVDTGSEAGTFTEGARSFLTATPPRYATIATINPDGSPHQTVIWYELRGDELVVNSRIGRRWPANLRRDARATVAVYDRADGVLIDCGVARTYDGPEALADICAMALRYVDEAEAAELAEEWRKQQRVTYVLRPIRVHLAGEPS